MGRRLSAALVLACSLVGGCTYSAFPAESSALACNNAVDDDGDLLSDCNDPDCWGFARCRVMDDAGSPLGPVPPFIPPPGGMEPPLDDDGDDAAPPIDVPAMPDAGRPPILEPPDAAVDAAQPILCDERCPKDQCATDGSCKVPLLLGDYAISSLELFAPRRYLHTENNQLACLDEAGSCSILLQDLDGCCPPDPTVFVLVQSKKAGFIGDRDTALKVWGSTGIELGLQEGDEVRFDVLDDDGENASGGTDYQPIFSCATTVSVAAVAAGEIVCVPEDVADSPPLGFNYHVTATLQRLAAGAAGDEDAMGDMP